MFYNYKLIHWSNNFCYSSSNSSFFYYFLIALFSLLNYFLSSYSRDLFSLNSLICDFVGINGNNTNVKMLPIKAINAKVEN